MTVPILCKVVMSNTDALPEDAFMTDLSFLASSTADAVLDGIGDSILSFYNTLSTQTNRMGAYISTTASRAANTTNLYFYNLTGHLDGSPHGSPIHTYSSSIVASTGADNLPDEVAVCFSQYASGYVSVSETAANPDPPPAVIRPRARYRGRFFFGPVNMDTMGTTEPPRPDGTDFLADASIAWARFMDERGADYAVWSRADATLRLVAPDGIVTCDDAYDTQRRRGPAATARATLWP